jgi:hypothetical protein
VQPQASAVRLPTKFSRCVTPAAVDVRRHRSRVASGARRGELTALSFLNRQHHLSKKFDWFCAYALPNIRDDSAASSRHLYSDPLATAWQANHRDIRLPAVGYHGVLNGAFKVRSESHVIARPAIAKHNLPKKFMKSGGRSPGLTLFRMRSANGGNEITKLLPFGPSEVPRNSEAGRRTRLVKSANLSAGTRQCGHTARQTARRTIKTRRCYQGDSDQYQAVILKFVAALKRRKFAGYQQFRIDMLL